MAQRGLEESMVGQVLAIVITFPTLALATVILRLYTRFFIIKNPSREDACIAIAMVCFHLTSENLKLTSSYRSSQSELPLQLSMVCEEN